jgi:hypothetical protein
MGLICVGKSTLAGAVAELVDACACKSAAAAAGEVSAPDDFVAPDSGALELEDSVVRASRRAHAETPRAQAKANIKAPIRMVECYSQLPNAAIRKAPKSLKGIKQKRRIQIQSGWLRALLPREG